jgi:myo-inositol-1-phosphate synthase
MSAWNRRMQDLVLAVVGLSGCIGTTLAAGLAGLRRGIAPRGLLTELPWPIGPQGGAPLVERLELAPLAAIRVTGWDLDRRPLASTVREKGIVPRELAQAVAEDLEGLVPLRPLAPPWGDALRGARDHLRGLRDRGHAVVLIDLLPAFETPPRAPAHEDCDAFERALLAGEPSVTPSMAYAWLALSEGIPYLNFTPNVGVELPALRQLAARHRAPFCGKDGKTGQTLLKTALAPMLALRGLRVHGWISANYLGNADGENLSHPEHAVEKLRNKTGVLDDILGYPVENHLVDIRYYGPRGDFKESWDNVDFEGFCGVPMQLKVNLLGGDSILAAPVALDAARLLERAARAGASGPQEQLSLFFKQPVVDGVAVHDLFRQRSLLEGWVDAIEGAGA